MGLRLAAEELLLVKTKFLRQNFSMEKLCAHRY